MSSRPGRPQPRRSRRPPSKMDRLCKAWAFLSLARHAAADLNNLYPPTYTSNPVARHVAFNVEVNKPGIAQLSGYEESNHPLEYYITSLPEVGSL